MLYMKVALISFLLYFPSALIFSQSILESAWLKIKTSDIGSKAEAWGVDVDEQGNIFWPISINHYQQGLDVICYKYDERGTDLWQTPLIYGGPGTQHSYVCNAQDSFLYIGGRYCTLFPNTCDMLLLKVNKDDQNIEWVSTAGFGHDGYDEVDGLEIREDGIYCGGWAHGNKDGIYFPDIGLWKLDFQGNTEWKTHFGTEENGEHQDGHFVVDDEYIYCAGLWGGTGTGNIHNGYSFLGKFDRHDGSFVDSTLFGDQSNSFNDIENALGMTSDGEYLYVTGYATPDSLDNWQIFTAKFDKDLNLHWMRDWGGSGNESARTIVVNDGIVYIAGLTLSPELSSGGQADAVLITYDTAGYFLNYQTWGDENDNSFRDMVVTADALYLSGTSGPQLFTGEATEAMLMKVEKENVVKKIVSYDETMLVYPNPSQGQIFIDSDNWLPGAELEIYDLMGKRVFLKQLISNKEKIQLSIPEGVYPFRVYYKERILKEGKITIVY